MSTEFDLPFTTLDGAELKWDFFPAEPQAPCVVLLHGGGWISGDRTMMHDVGIDLQSRGFSAACVQYRLAPLHPCPTAIEDAQAFIRHLRANASTHAVDPSAIAALGNSAGGHLASMLGVTDAVVDGVSSRVNAVVDLCGISDLSEPDVNHFPISMSFLEQFMGAPYRGSEENWRAASPLQYVDAQACPFFIGHGEADDVVPISQSEALAGKLFANGVPVEFHRLPGEGHSFTYDGWYKVFELFVDFLNRTFAHVSAQ